MIYLEKDKYLDEVYLVKSKETNVQLGTIERHDASGEWVYYKANNMVGYWDSELLYALAVQLEALNDSDAGVVE